MAEIKVDEDMPIDLDAPLDAPAPIEKVMSVEEIQAMIAQLSVTEDGEPLKKAMADLKKAIKDNPHACSALLPEDIGEMVKALYKMTDRDLTLAIEKAKKKGSKKGGGPKVDLSDAKIQQEILDDL